MADTTQPGAGPLTDAERAALIAVATCMIPAGTARRLPGADDPAIFSDILKSLGRNTEAVRAALRALDTSAGGAFADLDPARQMAVAEAFRAVQPAHAMALATAVAQSYYRDDRVMRAIGMEPRPPFPKGFDVEPGDWSLLEPVRRRGKVYREVT
jgi:hypothetical protein